MQHVSVNSIDVAAVCKFAPLWANPSCAVPQQWEWFIWWSALREVVVGLECVVPASLLQLSAASAATCSVLFCDGYCYGFVTPVLHIYIVHWCIRQGGEHACARTVAFLLLSSLEQSEPACGISLFEL
jgi:hypothetical protein